MQQNYAYLWDNILFLFFGDQGTTMLLTREQRQWLKFMTAEYPDKTTITVSHQGFKREEEDNTYRYYNDQEWWQSFINNNSQIALHIHGHNHMFKHYKYHGLDCIDVGITNSQGGKPWTVYFEITDKAIRAGIYDVLTQDWVKNNFFEKKIETTFKNEGIKWYSVSKRVQDKEEFTMNNRILAKNHSLQFIGSDTELIEQNRKFSHWGHKDYENSLLYGIGYEDDANNGDTEGEVKFAGKDSFATSISPSLESQVLIGWYVKWEEGKVPDSTTPIAIPGESYRIKIRAKANKDISGAMDVSMKILGKNLSNVISEHKVMENLDLTPSYQWFESEFSVPDNKDAWIMQTIWQTKKEEATCFLDEWSIARDYDSPRVENFSILINGYNCTSYQPRGYNDKEIFHIPNTYIGNKLNIQPQINGSKSGLIRLIYEDPLLWSDDLSFGTTSFTETEFEVEFNLVSPAAFEDYISVSIFNPNEVQIKDRSKVNLKGNSYAWIFNKNEIPEKYIIEL